MSCNVVGSLSAFVLVGLLFRARCREEPTSEQTVSLFGYSSDSHGPLSSWGESSIVLARAELLENFSDWRDSLFRGRSWIRIFRLVRFTG